MPGTVGAIRAPDSLFILILLRTWLHRVRKGLLWWFSGQNSASIGANPAMSFLVKSVDSSLFRS